MKLVLPGGNGFIGSEICRIAVRNGHDVAAFGRSGRPDRSPARHPWVQNVDWQAADVFAPETWRDLLEGADAVVHCISTIIEAPSRGVTYDRVVAESALRSAEEAADAGVDTFVFLSAQDNPPFVDPAFLKAKRRAERELSSRHPDMRLVQLRPNLVYGPGRTGSSSLAALLPRLERLWTHPYTSNDGRSLPVELVAATAVQAATSDALEGVLTVPQIADIGRTSGLISLDSVSDASLAPLLYGVGGTALAGWLLARWLKRRE